MVNRNIRYVHHESVHNFSAAEEIVPYILSLLEPNSVVDVGCGTGTWLKVFSDNGITDFLGIDGNYVDRNTLKINSGSFIEFDLETFYSSQRKFDLAISLEVAEHLKEESAAVFIKSLTNLSDVVIFSAAIPNQGGQNHLNEQEPFYWISKFEKEGFECFDILRPVFWENKKVDCWYRQNIFLFTKNEALIDKLNSFDTFLNHHLVHPELLKIKERVLESQKSNYDVIISGKKGIKFYFQTLFMALKSRI
ncbi:methyltransferase domain-containing protein [Flavobacterium sp. WC2429]|uniref:Methyltransferase domain-containing protein n=1 Tax=Flavobacterium sp. WC2429 TaxID=3234140 RepID=A0AB39WMK4_9FLAO